MAAVPAVGGSPNGCVRVTLVDWVPITISRGSYHGGIAVDVIRMVAKANGFCLDFTQPPNGITGLRLPNGTWDGMIGQINRTDADMTGTPIFMTEPRARIVDFSVPIYFQEHKIMYLTPQMEPNIAGFLLPFSPLVWMTTFAMLIAIILILMILFFLYDSIYEMWGRHEHIAQAITPSARDQPGWRSFEFTVGTLFGQSIPWSPTPVGVVLFLTGLWMMVAFVVGTVYRSNLKSMIILPRIQIPFETLEELVNQDEYKIITGGGGSFHQKVMEAPHDSTLGRLMQVMEVSGDIEYAFAVLMRGTHAAIGNEIMLDLIHQKTYMMLGVCKHTITKKGFVTGMQMSYVFQKGSPLKAMFDKTITRLKEGGILDFLLRRSLSKAALCKRKQKQKAELRALAFWDVAGMVMVYLGGIALSLITFGVELFLRRDVLPTIGKRNLSSLRGICRRKNQLSNGPV